MILLTLLKLEVPLSRKLCFFYCSLDLPSGIANMKMRLHTETSNKAGASSSFINIERIFLLVQMMSLLLEF